MEIVQQSISHFLGLNILTDSAEPTRRENTVANSQTVFTRQPSLMSYYQKPIFIKDNKINDNDEMVDKIIIDTRNYPCPCSDCGGNDISTSCLLDARIVELQNKFNNVKTYFNQKDKQYIITIPKKIKIPSKNNNSNRDSNRDSNRNYNIYRSRNTYKNTNNSNKKKYRVTFKLGESEN
tara:strand:- start:945 stop:1481 length:537 start_codon:yes stop_codon:yes gene_type:complete